MTGYKFSRNRPPNIDPKRRLYELKADTGAGIIWTTQPLSPIWRLVDPQPVWQTDAVSAEPVPGMWEPADYEGGDPDERSYAARSEPEPYMTTTDKLMPGQRFRLGPRHEWTTKDPGYPVVPVFCEAMPPLTPEPADPILQRAARRSALVRMAKLLPELEKTSRSLDRSGDYDQRDAADLVRKSFATALDEAERTK